MSKRLVKVAKELNVGTTTIVDHLKDSGFEVENKPNAKITEDMYDELRKFFQSSLAIKEQADQLIIGTRPTSKRERDKERVKVPPVPPKKEVTTVPPPTQPPIPPKKKEVPVAKTTPDPVTKPKENQLKEVTSSPSVKPIRVLGKIDLDKVKKGVADPINKQINKQEENKPNFIQKNKEETPEVATVEIKTTETTPPAEKIETKTKSVPTEVAELAAEPSKQKLIEETKSQQDKKLDNKATTEVEKEKIELPIIEEKEKPVSKGEDIKPDQQLEIEKSIEEKTEPSKAPQEEVPTEKIKDKEPETAVLPTNEEDKSEILEKDSDTPQPQAKKKTDAFQPPSAAKTVPQKTKPSTSDKDQKEKPEEKQTVELKEPPKEAAANDVVAEESKTAASSDEEYENKENYRAVTPELRGLKILGKIDTNQFKRSKRRKKKKDKNRDKDKAKPKEKNVTPSASTDKPKVSDNKSSAQLDDENKKRRKRRRKRKKVSTNELEQNREKNNRGDNRDNRGDSRSSRSESRSNRGDNRGDSRDNKEKREKNTSRRSRDNNNNSQRSRDRRRPRKRGERRRNEEVKEVSQKEIDDKIKATLARMTGGGKKKRQKIRRDNRERLREKQEQRKKEKVPEKLQVAEFISVSELASVMDVTSIDVITTCMNLGVIVSINQRLDAEIIELVADNFGHEVEFISAEEHISEEEEIVDNPEDLQPRAPIVTVMGHVDHGKTSLLDYIRNTNVAEGEAGGITQHIGAYEVRVGEESKRITFLDTPGHEAFTAMRARGAKVTDIAVIIIAADDSIMPQTREAISHAQAAGVPMVFAINKIDKNGANPEKIKQELASMNLLVEDWGGQYQSQDISAKTGLNIDLLLEKILLEAELLELKANPDRNSIGVVLEASLDKGRGYVAKTLVQTGTLKIGDPVVAGEYSGKVKAMFNERGKRVKKVGPASPVLVLGLDGAPQAGEIFKVMDTEQMARQIASKRAQIVREQANRATKRISLDEIARRLALGTFKELNLIIKGDVDGSVEALSDSLIKLSVETIQVNVIHKAVGQIIESDVLLASASDAIIIGFQVRPSLGARKLAEREGVEIKMYSIIYEAIEEIKMAIEGMLEPTKEEKIVGNVDVREVYKISKVGTVAGCLVTDGKINRNNFIRVVREGIVIYPSKEGAHAELESLKRFKDDVKEVKNNTECGLIVKNFNDIKVGDVIEAYEIVEIKQTLN